MSERYHVPDDNCAYPWLDEFLCEYADGTMDDAARLAFEEYLRANPALADYVQRLCCTRQLLCRHGCHVRVPHAVYTQLQQKLACEEQRAVAQAPATHATTGVLTARLGTAATVTSAMILMLMVGMLVGTTMTVEEAAVVETDIVAVQPEVAPRLDRPALPMSPIPARYTTTMTSRFAPHGFTPVTFERGGYPPIQPLDTRSPANPSLRTSGTP